jgi:hypothetical protein
VWPQAFSFLKKSTAIAVLISASLQAGASATDGSEQSDTSGNSNYSDYLSPALRANVENLKRQARQNATDSTNLVARSRLLADWIDAHALAALPGSPFGSRVRLNAALGSEQTNLADKIAEVDALISEYTLRDERPEVLGVLSAESLGPFEAGGLGTIRQTWQVGSQGMNKGGGFWIARHFSALYGEFQTDDPSAEGYVSISSSKSTVEFRAKSILARGPHGGFRAPEPALAFELVRGELEPGDSVTITYGDLTGGGPGLRITSIAGDSVPLPVYVALDQDQPWLMLPIQPFKIRGSNAVGVHGFAPSIVAVGEEFEVSVRAEDQFYNRAHDGAAMPSFHVFDGQKLLAKTLPGGSAIQTFSLSFNEIGPKWLRIVAADGSITGRFNPILVKQNPAQRLFWGDTHGHSGYAEGIGNIDGFMRFARDDARLDFVTHSEHDTWLDEAEWRLMRNKTQEFDEPGKFTPFLGYEWTTPAKRGGHHNVLFRTAKGRQRVSALEFATLSELYLELREQNSEDDVLIIPHAHNPGDSRLSDPRMERLIEIMSMHGTHQWFAKNYLSKGHQVGFVAASDDHLSHPGYSAPSRDTLAQRGGVSGVFAAENSRNAIFNALRNRQTFASSVDRIIVEAALNETPMGQRAQFSESREIVGQVVGSHGIESITLFKNDRALQSVDYIDADWSPESAQQHVRIEFTSDSTPFYPGDAPRGWRHWKGQLITTGVVVDAAQGSDFVNPNTQYLTSADDAGAFNFATQTRGDESFIDLTLSNITADATLVLEMQDTLETGSAPPFLRTHQMNQGGRFEVKLSELAAGKVSQTFPVSGYEDGVSVRAVVAAPEKMRKFRFTDAEQVTHGDQYFVVVRQMNGGMAWSSPIWVGGYPAR